MFDGGEPSLRPNWDALENRSGDDWEDGRGLGTRALPLWASKLDGEDRKRDALRLCHALHHRRGLRGPVRARLGSLGRRACIIGMGACLWRRDDGSLLLLRFPFHGVGSVWQAVSRRH